MRKIAIVTFVLYLIILAKLVIFKGQLFYFFLDQSPGYRVKSQNASYTDYNLIPFNTIASFMTFHPSTSTSTKVFNLLGNIALFIPLGFLLPIIYEHTIKLKQAFCAALLLSVFFELYQLVTQTGQCDIDDVILNTLGGVIGYFIYTGFRTFLANRNTDTAT